MKNKIKNIIIISFVAGLAIADTINLVIGSNPGYDNEHAVIASVSTAFIHHRVEITLKGMFWVMLAIEGAFYSIASVVIDFQNQIKPDAVNADCMATVDVIF